MLLVKFSHLHTGILLLFYLFNFSAIVYIFRKNTKKKYFFSLESQSIEEKINLLISSNTKEIEAQSSFLEKIKRYSGLRKILEELNENPSLDYVADTLISIAYTEVSRNKGTALLYLADSKNNFKLNLFRSKKEDPALIIKSKEGDIFDTWVLRQSCALLIEDIHKDFRFDLDKIKYQQTRGMASLISVPIISGHNFLGVLRLDNPRPGFFIQDDLRFLATICDFGAVALESGQLFERTQELAIRDGLTALYRKEYFLERLAEECARSLRQKSNLTLLIIDIDYFKNYNDKFGHTAGDIVLKLLSNRLQEFFKGQNTIIGRFGGEEFCVAISGVTKEKTFVLAESLRKELEKTEINLRRQKTGITVSIGVAAFGKNMLEAKDLFSKADKALYKAKESGRNRVC